MSWLPLCPHFDLSKDHLHSVKNYLCFILHSFNFISRNMPINRISICLSQIVLDNFSLTLTSFVPRCLTTWLKECVRGIHKPENVESCSVCFKFTAWVTVNTHASWVPHITKVGKMCIRYRRVLTGPIKMGKTFLVFTPLSLSLSISLPPLSLHLIVIIHGA